MRVDAVRNRSRILAAAQDLVAREGAEMTMDVLAREAGVAVGTLYRHFPTKQDLLAAVVEESLERMADLSEDALTRVRSGRPPGQEVATLFRAIGERYASDRAVKHAATSLGLPSGVDVIAAPPGTPAARATRAISAILAAAREAGEIDPEVSLEDLVMLVEQLPDDPSGRASRRYTDVVLAGLRLT